MGIWNEVDAITRLTIHPGDEVAMIVPRYEKFVSGGIVMSRDPNYGSICQHLSLPFPLLARHVEFVYVGHYDGGGMIEEWSEVYYEPKDEFEDRPDLRSIFISQKVWDYIQDEWQVEEFDRLWDECKKERIGLASIPIFTRVYAKLLCFAKEFNIDLWSVVNFKGNQNSVSQEQTDVMIHLLRTGFSEKSE